MPKNAYWKRGLKPVRHRWDDALARMDPLEFEGLIADHYRREGFRVEHVGTGGSNNRYDGGIDLKLYRDDEFIVVQCKRHTVFQITHKDVHELLGIMHTERATGAIFVNSGEYTSAALSKLRGITNFQMIDGHELRRMLGRLTEQFENVQVTDDCSKRGFLDASGSEITSSPAKDLPPLEFRPRRAAISNSRSSRAPAPNSLWWVISLVGVVVFLVLIRSLFVRTAWIAGESVRSIESTQSQDHVRPSDEAPSVTSVDSTANASELNEQQAVTSQRPEFQQTAPKELTPAEIREAQRRADEAITVLEATTPEL